MATITYATKNDLLVYRKKLPSVSTYAEAVALATGSQIFEITVTADTDTTKNTTYWYDGVPGILSESAGRTALTLAQRNANQIDLLSGIMNGEAIIYGSIVLQ